MHVMNPSQAIEALRAADWTESEIASEVDVYQSTINRIRKGMPPTWELGQKIIACAVDNLPKCKKRAAPKK